MKQTFYIFFTFLVTFCNSQIAFEKNNGQVKNQFNKTNSSVLYTANTKQMAVHLKSNGMSYQLSKTIKNNKVTQSDFYDKKLIEKEDVEFYRLDLEWLNSNKNSSVSSNNLQQATNNYYIGSEQLLNVPSYNEIIYTEIYPQINLKWYSTNSSIKYDFILNPNANPNAIKLKINGATNTFINKKGELVLETPLGTIIEEAPVAHQLNKKIKVKWYLKNNCAGFILENYNHSLPLTIDPMLRYWGTYYGGGGNDYVYGNCVDNANNPYICGYTQSTVNISTVGSHQFTYAGGTNDAFVTKFNTNGVRLWSTYYGGTLLDVATAITFDANNNLFVSGYTDSNSGISTGGAHQPNIGGNVDAFLVKFNSSGIRQWGTYYNGTNNAYGQGVAVDNSGNVYMCGYTSSTNGNSIATAASHQPAHGGATWDAFLVKFSTTGTRLWATYYGDFGADYAFGCAADNNGNVFVVGKTSSNTGTNIASATSHQATSGGGLYDAYVVKFNSSGVRQWGTYYGGFNDETGSGCCVDAAGAVYASGSTDSGGGTPVSSSGAHQTTNGGGFADAYIVKFNSLGTRLWGSLYGGAGYEDGITCFADNANGVYLTGQTSSNTGTIMATTNMYQPIYGGGNFDSYLVKFNATTGQRDWGTYYGETGDDIPLAGSVDVNLNLYVAGRTSTNGGTGIASNGAHQTTYGGGSFDGFLVKLYVCPDILADIIATDVTCFGLANGTASIILQSSPAGLSYSWTPTGATTISITNLPANNYTCVITSTCGSVETLTTIVSQPSVASVSITSSQATLCLNSTATLSANGNGPSGPYTYTWSNNFVGTNNPVSPTVTTVYTVTATSVNNCTAQNTYTQEVSVCTSNITNYLDSEIELYPNPSNGKIYINNKSGLTLGCSMFDAFGKQVLEKTVNEKLIEFDCKNFSKGIYFVRIKTDSDGTPKVVKVLVE